MNQTGSHQSALVTGTARIVFMIGTPIAQARAPFLFNTHFTAQGLDRIMVPLDLAPHALPAFVSMVHGAENCDGFVVTLPHKRPLVDFVEARSETATALHSVNVVRRDAEGRLFGDMVDGQGFWNGVATAGFDPKGTAVALAGAGSAGTAIAYEFARRGGARIAVVTRDDDEFDRVATLLASSAVQVERGPPQTLHGFDMAINATPLGMAHAPGTAFPRQLLATLPGHAVVADAITQPLDTELLEDARALGLATVDGNAMTAGQFELLRAVIFG